MDRIYSLTLAAATVALGISVAALLVSRLATARSPAPHRVARLAALSAIGLALGSGLVHFVGGHWPGSVGAMGPLELAREHPALLFVPVLAALALIVSRRGQGGRWAC